VIKTYCVMLAFVISSAFGQSPIPAGAKLEKIVTGLLQPEGPIWKDGVGLLFSDIQGNTIYQWSPTDSLKKAYLYPSDSSNGLTLDLQGRLILTQMEKHRVSRQESNGTITPLVSTYNGKRFNSPNDVVVRGDGSIFFTDPDFNIPAGQKAELSFKGIYRISPSGALTLLDSSFDKPNGICFSPDEKKLYVNESPLGNIYVWDVVNDSIISNKKLFYSIPVSGYADGMKTDPQGNVYCTGPTGVWIISPAGVYLDKIVVPAPDNSPSNCNWGDADRKTLYITAGKSLYRIRLAASTGIHDHGSLERGTFKLYSNYPNPFNPTTNLRFTVPEVHQPSAEIGEFRFVSLKIYDRIGREVQTLVNQVRPAGDYSVQWNAAGFSSGAYFYRLKAGSFIETKKMVLMR